jgi:hypothetical protein
MGLRGLALNYPVSVTLHLPRSQGRLPVVVHGAMVFVNLDPERIEDAPVWKVAAAPGVGLCLTRAGRVSVTSWVEGQNVIGHVVCRLW